LHLRQINMRVVDHDAVLGRLLLNEHEMIARSQERFARDATHIEASATQLLVFFDESGF
jgi:hypothetical protein